MECETPSHTHYVCTLIFNLNCGFLRWKNEDCANPCVLNIVAGRALRGWFLQAFCICRQYLRLRGVNSAERDTREGQRAKNWLEKKVRANPVLLIRTHITDKYDRYISDVWLAVTDGALHKRRGAVVEPLRRNYTYINNALLENGLAVAVRS